jgi:(E)-4-hydroxy-3-methylbut-2-enyl-diphosphate synthase
VTIGAGAVVSVQGMAKTDTRDVEKTALEIMSLAEAGADIVRLAVPDMQAAEALAALRRRSPVPLVADIHFDYRLAVAALDAGVDKLRINPGNIGDASRVREVARRCGERSVPIRIGVNSGSLERTLLERYGGPTAAAMVESALSQARLLEDEGVPDIVLSLKSSDVLTTVAAYREIGRVSDYPLHLGVTEAGSRVGGAARSGVGLGILLAEGIGDTLRVSLSAPAVEEIEAGYAILGALGLRRRGVRVISCPSCGRSRGDLLGIAGQVERLMAAMKAPLEVAVMGCEVNGPGEARFADAGLALAEGGMAVLFREGRAVGRVPVEEAAEKLRKLVEAIIGDSRTGA